jgi:hypothetical protein
VLIYGRDQSGLLRVLVRMFRSDVYGLGRFRPDRFVGVETSDRAKIV